ncbi:YtxH domain-containing protein [Leifsonia poae]|uniref:YtxH domain-containing protein n=1 Tax=Leifsonia poae TaxID=110933 RepID=UPI001CBAD29A|nr:YtxH domain-containing protein [Leifsonia poae]
MRGKILFVAGAAVGYVLGARAGRKRYEQIKSTATKVWESPGIQKQVVAVEDFVAAKVGDLPGAVFDGARKLVVLVVGRHPEKTPVAEPAEPREKPATASAVAAKPAARKAPAKPAARKAPAKPAAGDAEA